MDTVIKVTKFDETNSGDFLLWQTAALDIIIRRALNGQKEFTVKKVTSSYAMQRMSGDSYTIHREFYTETYDHKSNLAPMAYFRSKRDSLFNCTVVRKHQNGTVTIYQIVNA